MGCTIFNNQYNIININKYCTFSYSDLSIRRLFVDSHSFSVYLVLVGDIWIFYARRSCNNQNLLNRSVNHLKNSIAFLYSLWPTQGYWACVRIFHSSREYSIGYTMPNKTNSPNNKNNHHKIITHSHMLT